MPYLYLLYSNLILGARQVNTLEVFDTMKRTVILLVVVGLLFLVYLFAFLINKNQEEFPESLNDIEIKVDKAIQSGDKRFLGVMRVGLVVPGVPDNLKDDSKANSVYVIPGTSDVIKGKRDEIYQKKAYQFALKYNEILLKKLKLVATSKIR